MTNLSRRESLQLMGATAIAPLFAQPETTGNPANQRVKTVKDVWGVHGNPRDGGPINPLHEIYTALELDARVYIAFNPNLEVIHALESMRRFGLESIYRMNVKVGNGELKEKNRYDQTQFHQFLTQFIYPESIIAFNEVTNWRDETHEDPLQAKTRKPEDYAVNDLVPAFLDIVASGHKFLFPPIAQDFEPIPFEDEEAPLTAVPFFERTVISFSQQLQRLGYAIPWVNARIEGLALHLYYNELFTTNPNQSLFSLPKIPGQPSSLDVPTALAIWGKYFGQQPAAYISENGPQPYLLQGLDRKTRLKDIMIRKRKPLPIDMTIACFGEWVLSDGEEQEDNDKEIYREFEDAAIIQEGSDNPPQELINSNSN